MYDNCGGIEKAVNYLKKCLKELGSHGDGMSLQTNVSSHFITIRPHFFEAFFQIFHCLLYGIMLGWGGWYSVVLVMRWRGINKWRGRGGDMNKWNKRWKVPWIGKLRMRMRTLKIIWRGIFAKGLVSILKVVSSWKKCLEEMWSHGDGMPFHHHETTFLWGIYSNNSLLEE